MSITLALTGSIGMGKSTTAQMFVAHGCGLWDADEAVHRLYAPGGAAVEAVAAAVPAALDGGGIDRAKLRSAISNGDVEFAAIEAIVHPLVAADRRAFLGRSPQRIIVLDIPLLFETGAETEFDAVACVSTTPELQRKRVLERPGMTESVYEMLVAKQMPSTEKCARSDYVIDTTTMETAEMDVARVIEDLKVRFDA